MTTRAHLHRTPLPKISSIPNSAFPSRSIPAKNVVVLQLAGARSYLHFSKNYLQMPANMNQVQTLNWDTSVPMGAKREKKVCYLLDHPECFSHLIARHRWIHCPIICVHHPIIGSFIHRRRTAFLLATICSSAYRRLWTCLEELHTWHAWIERGVRSDEARRLEVTREEHCERCVSISLSVLALDPSPQGRRNFNITPNRPASRFLRRPALFNTRSSC